MRLDVFLQSQLRNTSRTRARAIIENSAYSPDGRHLRASDRVKAEERIALWRPPFEDDEEVSSPLPVVYEDEHLLAIDKPPLVTVHPTARYYRNTVIKRLEAERPGEFLSLIHRLDRETSGILMLARSPAADRAFKRILEDKSLELARGLKARRASELAARSPAGLPDERRPRFEKTYLAITWGVPEAGLIDAPLEADDDNPLRVKMRLAENGGLEALTGVKVREHTPGYALVSCDLYTGRQHQIRLHLASRGTPVVGDKLYGPDERLLARAADGELTEADVALLELPRHALHAHRYRLPHPFKDDLLELESPLPPDLSEFWNSLPKPKLELTGA